MSKTIYTILLLVSSNVFMTLAWYGHLRLQVKGTTSNWPAITLEIFVNYFSFSY